jgi:hypothetical protein
MKKNFLSDGWSDLENEFDLELEDSSSQEIQEGEFELADEEWGDVNNELESAEGEFEMEAGADYEDDHELEEPDHESRQWLGESNDYEYEDRIYAALNGEYESSYEMEQELDRVLYEMEMDYFWKSANKLWKKHKNKILGAARGFLPSGTLQTLAKVAGGDIRGLLKSDLLKKGLSLAANAVAPGVGGAIAGSLLDSELGGANNLRNQASQFVSTAKNAYQNMARYIPNLKPGNIPQQLTAFSRQAFHNAVQRQNSYKGKKRHVIPTVPGSIVVVKPGRIIIYS